MFDPVGEWVRFGQAITQGGPVVSKTRPGKGNQRLGRGLHDGTHCTGPPSTVLASSNGVMNMYIYRAVGVHRRDWWGS